MNMYFQSVYHHSLEITVTEEEIYRGILEASNVDTGCYWFKRTITDLEDHMETTTKMTRRFMDMVGKGRDAEALDFLKTLKYV